MKLNSLMICVATLLSLLTSMPQAFSAAKRNQKMVFSSSSTQTDSYRERQCCKKVLELAQGINATTKKNYQLDLETNALVQEDLTIDQETLNIVTAIENIVNQLNADECKPIDQGMIDAAGGTLTLTESGKYCATENLVGSLVLDSDSIWLDLSFYILDANGAATAISSTNHEGVVISSGYVQNSTSAAVLFTGCTAVEVRELHLENNSLDAIRASSSQQIHIHDIDSIGLGRGERIVKFDTCKNIRFSQSAATGYLSTIGAIVEFNSCIGAALEDIEVTDNTKTISTPNTSTSINASFIHFDSCKDINLTRVKANNNIFNSPVAGNKQFSVLGFINSKNCTINSSQTNDNIDIAGLVANTDIVEDNIVYLQSCDSFKITNHQSNNNSCTATILTFTGYYTLNSTNIIIDGCQANNNLVATQSAHPNIIAQLIGIYINTNTETCIVRNCQANFNTVNNGNTRPGTFASVAGIEIQDGAFEVLIDNCQACYNTMNTTGALQQAIGIYIFANAASGSNITISNCIADNNRGGEKGLGILSRYPDLVTIKNCSASSNSRYGISIGTISFPNSGSNTNVQIFDCTCYLNGNNSSTSAGILLIGTNSINVHIKNCEVNDTFSNAGASGIEVIRGINVTIEDTNVFGTTSSTGTANGILLNNCSDSKIIRAQLNRNKNAGVELISTNSRITIIDCSAVSNGKGFEFASGSTASCCLVQNNKAINNTTAGFVYAASPTPFTVTFMGNEAQCNGTTASTDNFSLGTNKIPLQSLSWSTGISTQIGATTAGLGSAVANTYMIP
ncbi:MAG: right-handed parallel beta-helix repeat-containing protein [Verrucomicrobia bacterium]|nr:right-handed parallel beta-helix repeat-containing protein [Verrucomicrobiota bacterium]MBS0636301.1 right-handed parallel beta-helix repeat-containing protein [Verrucomicrobiota bacterium]